MGLSGAQGVAVPIFPEYSSEAVDDPWPCSCHRTFGDLGRGCLKSPKKACSEGVSEAFSSLRIATQNSEVLVADATHNAYKAHQSLASMWLNKGACIECPGRVKVY